MKILVIEDDTGVAGLIQRAGGLSVRMITISVQIDTNCKPYPTLFTTST
jgi:hypothetical protein